MDGSRRTRKNTRPDEDSSPKKTPPKKKTTPRKKSIEVLETPSGSERQPRKSPTKKSPMKLKLRGFTTSYVKKTKKTNFKCNYCHRIERNITSLNEHLLSHNESEGLRREQGNPHLGRDNMVPKIPTRWMEGHHERSIDLMKKAISGAAINNDEAARQSISRQLFKKPEENENNNSPSKIQDGVDFINAQKGMTAQLEMAMSNVRIKAGRAAFIINKQKEITREQLQAGLKDVLLTKRPAEDGKACEIIMTNVILNLFDNMVEERHLKNEYRERWTQSQKSSCEEKKLRSRTEEDFLTTIRENLIALRTAEEEVDNITLQKTILESKYDALNEMHRQQSLDMAKILENQLIVEEDDYYVNDGQEPGCSHQIKEEEISMTGRPASDFIEEEVPLNSNGRFDKSTKRKGGKAKQSRPKRKKSEVNTNGLNIDRETALRLLDTSDSDE